MKAKFDALTDFVSEIVGLIAADQKLSKTYAEIATAVEDTIKFEAELVAELLKKKWNVPASDADPFSIFDRAKFSNLKLLVPQINWDDFVRDTPLWDAELKAFLQRDPEVLFYSNEIRKAADAFFKAADPKRLSNYLFVTFLIRKSPYLDLRFAAAANRFATKVDANPQTSTRPQDCVGLVVANFQLVSDHLYTTNQSLGEMAVQISEHAARFNLKQLLDQYLGITLDPQTRVDQVNAFSLPNYNTISILQPPFADPKQSAAVNYGSIGYLVGHEFSHLFDDQGMDFDEIGAKRNWWSASARRQFERKAKCLEKRFSALVEPHVRKHVNGSLTLGENIADSAGIRASFRAYKHHLKGRKERHVLGYSKYTNEQASFPLTFFISFARTWCTANSLDVINGLLAIDTHSPNLFRVNIVVSNFPEFSKAFKCRRGTKMNPRKQCFVW
ncbi:Peptidase M13 domain containing protein [Aphelenchoides fujianensis]|nr:Peptidase M13 domain containing protein [Aphelenchoides fujianensis]